MSALTFLAGAAHWSVYAMLFSAIVLIALSTARRVSWRTVIGAAGVTALAYFMPIVFCGGIWIVGGLWFMGLQSQVEAIRGAGVVSFSHNFFGDNRFTGWSAHKGANYLPIQGNEIYVPQAMRDAAAKAVQADPFGHPCGVIVRTEVHLEKQTPVIVDYVATTEQFARRKVTGMWDVPQDYRQHEKGIVTHNDPSGAQGTIDGHGFVTLSAPKGPAAEFLSQFNGPKLTAIVRK